MTLIIKDLGDVWTYDEYAVTKDYQLGLTIELTGTVSELPWMYARKVAVTIENPQLNLSFTGHVDRPTTTYATDEEMTTSVVLSEAPVF